MIYITADTHGPIDLDKIKNFLKTHNVNKKDFLIILGDVNCPRFYRTLENCEVYEFWKSVPMTVLFIDGNHENFYELNKLPIEIWNGGKVHRIGDNMLHLMRGQIFTIEGKTFFTMGGATSIDKMFRTPNETWFQEEDCSYAETNEALDNLSKVDNTVDYILTHTIGSEFIAKRIFKSQPMYSDAYGNINNFLDYINDIVSYKKWYFGHFHMDVDYCEDKKECLYNLIKEIK